MNVYFYCYGLLKRLSELFRSVYVFLPWLVAVLIGLMIIHESWWFIAVSLVLVVRSKLPSRPDMGLFWHRMARVGWLSLIGLIIFGWTLHPVLGKLSRQSQMRPIVIATKPTFATVDARLSTDQHQLVVTLGQLSGYSQLSYTVLFQTDAAVDATVTGSSSVLSSGQNVTIDLDDCTVQPCTYSIHPQNIRLSINLTGAKASPATLTEQL